jgi:5-methyltetrahydrofolate--homocysteine methyltransferase
VLAEYGIGHMAYELNVKAAQLAKRVAADFSTKDKAALGRRLDGAGHEVCRRSATSHFADLKAAYAEQVRGLLDGGVDLLIVETCQDLLADEGALAAIFEEFEKNRGVRVPVIAQVTIEIFGTMLNGTEIGAALTALEPFPD